MKSAIVSFFTRTPLHIGCGSSIGIVDSPLLRERTTGFPILPGSSLKGVLADLFLEECPNQTMEEKRFCRTEEGKRLLGEDNPKADAKRGKLLIGEGRLVAFPVRSAKKGFAWITCPLILSRLGLLAPEVGEMDAYGSVELALETSYLLEEYRLARKDAIGIPILETFRLLCGSTLWQETLKDRLVLVSDTMFAYFAQNACEIANHNRIDDETGTVAEGGLFSQENVPSETLFVATFQAQEESSLVALKAKIADEKDILQIGSDITTGLGWCEVTFGDTK